MTTGQLVRETPATAPEIAELLAHGRPTRPLGGATKAAWGAVGPPPELEISTERLNEVTEHNEGDLTAVLQAGVPLHRAQETFAQAGQRLALDPPDPDRKATIGGVVATADSGPLRHRYGGIRDLILGVQVAMADGTVARAGSRVIKNVAGYDLAKLMCGAYGTLGVVCEVIVRLHPQPTETVTVTGRGEGARALASAAAALRRKPLELEALDVAWDGGSGAVFAQAAGRAAEATADAIAEELSAQGLQTEAVSADAPLWEAQRQRQRTSARDRAVVRVSYPPLELERVLSSATTAVARAGAGLAWVTIDADPDTLARLRAELNPAACVLLDAPSELREAADVWGQIGASELELMRRVKQRFDPGGICNPGRFLRGL